MKLSEYVAEHGMTALCAAIGAHVPDMSRWARGLRDVPIERCLDIETATGGCVTRRDLHPRWYRIWPELVTADHPAPQEEDRAAA